jgi:hypothetical protein
MSRGWMIGCVLAVVTAVAVGIVLLSSGDDSASSSAATTTPSDLPLGFTEDQQAQLEQFRNCLSEEGVEPPAPGGAARRTPSPELLSAVQTCQRYMPDGLVPGGGGAQLRIAP